MLRSDLLLAYTHRRKVE